MDFPIEDQLVKGYKLGKATGEFSPEMLISEMVLNTTLYGIKYKDGVLTVDNLKGKFTEAYVDNGILKVK